MNQPVDLDFSDRIKQLKSLGEGEWITVWSKNSEGNENTFCALIPLSESNRLIEDPSWNLQIGDGRPCFAYHYENGQKVFEYHRFGNEDAEPLIFWRSFGGIKEGYWEVLEEFRHYFNLYEDKKDHKFLFIDDNGDEQEVVTIQKNQINIKLKFLKEFLAVKNMDLVILFDYLRSSDKSLAEQGLKESRQNVKKKQYVYSKIVYDEEDHIDPKIKSQSWMYGKKIIYGAKNFSPDFDTKKCKKCADFIIGFDKNGNELTFTCDEKKLSNFFGKNPKAPNYLTPVFFRKEVLTKYYNQPTKYFVSDGCLQCGNLWMLRMDNNNPDFVVVFLGDLVHLSYNEQLHWRHHNMPIKGKISYTAWKRNFEAKFADPERSDLFFKKRYVEVKNNWKEKFGWEIFLSLSAEDEYHFRTLRIPLTNEQKEFDEQVLSLTKLMIDSLNENELSKHSTLSKEGAKGIDKLELFLQSNGRFLSGMIQYLRELQSLRSSGVAHLKGKKYLKIQKDCGIGEEKTLQEVFDNILMKAIWTLNTLNNIVPKNGCPA
ncbi:MAG: hypothetical protein ACFCUE_15725 [Candidatus Bathyarchaeia archaeon]